MDYMGFAVHPNRVKGRSTVHPAADFKPREDSEKLREAMKGLGTDEEAIIEILCYRSSPQRLEIAKTFKTIYGRELKDDLTSELSGNFREVMLALVTHPVEYYASQLKAAVKGLGTDEKCIIEIMCTFTNEQIKAVRDTYEEMFKTTLENDLVDDTSGYFRRLLRSLSTARRSEAPGVNEEAAIQDAERLYAAGEMRLGTDESTFNEILCSRSYQQLLQIFKEYEKLTGHTMETAIQKEFSGSIKEGLLAIVQCVRNKIDFFVEKLYHSMKGLGTDDKTLVRVVVTHCEVDMVEIKEAFFARYEKTLESFIEGDTSGHYRKSLLALVQD